MAIKKTAVKEEVVGAEAVKLLQEKQIDKLEKLHKALSVVTDGYTDSIEDAKTELNDLYYKIQKEEFTLKQLKVDTLNELEELRLNEIKEKEARIEKLNFDILNLEKEYKVAKSDFIVNHKLMVKESKEATLQELLNEFDRASISNIELEDMKMKLSTIEDTLIKKGKADLAIAESRAERRRVADLKELELTNLANTAKLEAQNENAEKQLEFYKLEMIAANQRNKDLLDTNVKVAEAAKGTVINTSK